MENLREKEIYKVTITGSVINLLLLLFKFIAGIMGNSTAMIADAIHSLSDFITDIIVIIFVKISHKPQDTDHDYGHGKFETFATLLIGLVLLFVGAGIAWSSFSSISYVIQRGTLQSPGYIALIAALLSLLTKEILFRYTILKGKKSDSSALVANAWHHRSDAFSSIATTIGIGGALLLGNKWAVLDPIAALLVSFFILRMAINLMKPCLDELMEKSLPENVKKEITDIVYSFEEVEQLHNLRTRKIGNYSAIEMHIRMDGNMSLFDSHTLITQIENELKKHFGEKTYINIHMEPKKSINHETTDSPG
jgi:cation diffusion facilitator family transporter